MNKEEEREMDEEGEQMEKEQEYDVWKEVYGQEGILEECGNGKSRRRRQSRGKAGGDRREGYIDKLMWRDGKRKKHNYERKN